MFLNQLHDTALDEPLYDSLFFRSKRELLENGLPSVIYLDKGEVTCRHAYPSRIAHFAGLLPGLDRYPWLERTILELVLDFNLINKSTLTTKVVTHHNPLHFRPESPKYNDIMDVYDKRQAVDIPEHLRERMPKCAHNSVSGRVFQQ